VRARILEIGIDNAIEHLKAGAVADMVKFAPVLAGARSKADADTEDTGDGRAEDVEELWKRDYPERERRGHSSERRR